MNLFESVQDLTAVCWCLVALTAWLVTAWLHRVLPETPARLALLLPRIGAGFIVWLMLTRITSGLTETTQFLPFWLISLAAAIVSEIVFRCYAAEPLPDKPAHRRRLSIVFLMPLLRLLAVGLVMMQLLQPTRSKEEEHREERTVAVVLDTSGSMELQARITPDDDRTRRQIAREVLDDAEGGGGLLERLRQRYTVRLYRMDAVTRLSPEDGFLPVDTRQESGLLDLSAESRRSTNFAGALRRINGDIPSSELSGVVMVTDGCDHSDSDISDFVGYLETNGIPLSSVMIGSSEPIRDAKIVTLQAPSQIFHGDELTLEAVVHADRFQDEIMTVRLLDDDQVVEEQQLQITSDRHRETVRFRHEPTEARLHNFRVELAELTDDETPENNGAESQVWVSEDRIRVLLVEDRPRWEFRYLRNLLAGRDRSIFLQAVLLKPDRLAGVPDPMVIRASALRAFDDCNANALPADEAEWLKFDVIILGDVNPNRLGRDGIRVLETFVQDHGGSLVVLSGPNHMPHSYGNTPLQDLLPARIAGPPGPADNQETGIRFRPTAEGLSHVVLQRTGMNTQEAWKSFPELSWRHPAGEAKVGATVLAFAADRNVDVPGDAEADAPGDVERQRRRALMLWHRVGAGKVLQLNFDESWRLRYGIGHRLHHQFWGQIVRWCAGDRLFVGTDLVRMGTDKVMYHAEETIRVRARMLDAQRNPVVDGEVRATLLRNDEVVQSVELAPVPGKSGLLAGEIRGVNEAGVYRVQIDGEQVDQCLQADSSDAESIGLNIGVRASATGRESSDVLADETVLRHLADRTGGIVTTPEDVQRIPDSLGPESSFHRTRRTTPLWNTWPVILTFLGCVSLEWSLRKATGRV